MENEYSCNSCGYVFSPELSEKIKNNIEVVCEHCGTLFYLPNNVIFLSSTSDFEDLMTHLCEKLPRIGYDPIWYKKKFEIASGNVFENVFRNLQRADKFVLVLGSGYGTLYPDSEHSITKEEYDRALQANKTILVFIKSEVLYEYKNRERLTMFSVDTRVFEFIQELDKNKSWYTKFDNVYDILKAIENQWGVSEIYKKAKASTVPMQDLSSDLDNYYDVMRCDVNEAEYFRMLEPSATRGAVFHADIENETVIKIDNLIEDIYKKVFTESKWVLLSGASGFSKTTTAKIFAHDVKFCNKEEDNREIFIRFEDKLENIKNFVRIVKDTHDQWLLIIDDLHREEYGEVDKKLASLAPLFKNRNTHVLSISRLSLKQIKELCRENKNREREVAEQFAEIDVNLYIRDLNEAKKKLIRKVLQHRQFSDFKMYELENKLVTNYSADFVFLGFALLHILQQIADDIDDYIIFNGIKEFLLSEFEEILKKTTLHPRILLRVFIGLCYESLVDETVSVNDFDNTEDSRNDIYTTLNRLVYQGLVLKSTKISENPGKIGAVSFTFSLSHAKIAEIYLKALRTSDLWIQNQNFVWEELCTLSNFNAHISHKIPLEEIFNFFKKLIKLDLSYNDFMTLPESITKLTSLQELGLGGNKLTTLPESITKLTSLQILGLSGNNFTTLPESIGNLTLLKELSFGGNWLSTLPESIGNLSSLKKLWLEGNRLSTLPESIGNLKSLQTLELFNNRLSTLPESITKLTSLQILGLSGNNFTTFPESIGNLKSLQILGLGYNNFTTLPESIGNLTSLKELSLDGNWLSTLPDSIGNLISLQRLVLEDNNLTTLPESIGNLSSLEILRLEYNQLSTFPVSIGNLSSLKELRLYNNKLTTLPESITKLESLESLNLGGNKIMTLPESIGNLSTLQELYLYYNKLTTLPESIVKLSSLEKLWLENNRLITLPESIKILEKRGVTIYK